MRYTDMLGPGQIQFDRDGGHIEIGVVQRADPVGQGTMQLSVDLPGSVSGRMDARVAETTRVVIAHTIICAYRA